MVTAKGVCIGAGELPGPDQEVVDDLELVVGVARHELAGAADEVAEDLLIPCGGRLAGLFTVTANNNGPVGAAINALVAAEALWIIAASLTLPLRKPQASLPARSS